MVKGDNYRDERHSKLHDPKTKVVSNSRSLRGFQRTITVLYQFWPPIFSPYMESGELTVNMNWEAGLGHSCVRLHQFDGSRTKFISSVIRVSGAQSSDLFSCAAHSRYRQVLVEYLPSYCASRAFCHNYWMCHRGELLNSSNRCELVANELLDQHSLRTRGLGCLAEYEAILKIGQPRQARVPLRDS